MSFTIRGGLVTDYEVWPGASLFVEGDSIRELDREGQAPKETEVYDYGDSIVTPGFVDLQVNGGFGIDVATAPDLLPKLSEKLLTTGVTAYLPTLISSPRDLYKETLPKVSSLTKEHPGGAEVLGAHLEGPFIEPEKHGAHSPEHVLQPDSEFMEDLLELGPVRMITLAPELEGSSGLTRVAADRGVTVSAGHSKASFEEAYESFDRRVGGVTHLFNAMGAMHHREPGLPGAAFAHPRVVCGLIADGLHVHPEVVGLSFRMLGPDRVYLTTDSTAATGMEPGQYELANRKIFRDADKVRLEKGGLAGSLISMNEAFQNILAFTGCTLPEASRMVSATPARLVGEGRRRGRLASGYKADITVLRPDLSVQAVWISGKKVY